MIFYSTTNFVMYSQPLTVRVSGPYTRHVKLTMLSVGCLRDAATLTPETISVLIIRSLSQALSPRYKKNDHVGRKPSATATVTMDSLKNTESILSRTWV